MDTNRHTLNRRVVCKDGFSFSCQANQNAYCVPRKTHTGWYSEVEVGFPTMHEPLLHGYIEDPQSSHEQSVYPYVPVQLIYVIIVKHGGILRGEVPRGVPEYGVTHCKKKDNE
jgi:hypothetical protein